MNNIYVNFYAVGWLIFGLFCITSSLFCLVMRNKSSAALHLGLTFLFGSIASIAYASSFIWYNPVFSIHRYFTIVFVLVSIIHICQFILSFPEDFNPKIRRVFLIAMWAITLITAVIFMAKSTSAQYKYHFDGHYWDFALDYLSRRVGILILFYAAFTIIIGFWRAFVVQGKERLYILIITFSFIIVTIIPSILNILSRDGAMERDIYFVSMNFLNMLGYLIIFILFINYTKDKMRSYAQIVNTGLVIILFLLLGFSYYISRSVEGTYDELHNKQIAKILSDSNFRPSDIEYIVEYSVDKDIINYNLNRNNIPINFRPYKNELLNTLMWEEIRNLNKVNFIENLKKLLDTSHPYFAGYKNTILTYIKTLPPDKQNPDEVLAYIKGLKRSILYRYNKVKDIPIEGFRTMLPDPLKGMSNSLEPFKHEIGSVLMKEVDLVDRKLKWKVLHYLDPMDPPENRQYREDKIGRNRFVSFRRIDIAANKIYEVGFSYQEYRAYIHLEFMKFMYLLAFLFIAVIMVHFYFKKQP